MHKYKTVKCITLKKIICFSLTVLMVMLMTSCDFNNLSNPSSRENHTNASYENKKPVSPKNNKVVSSESKIGVSAIMKASDYLGIVPTESCEGYECFNCNVSLQQLNEYACYILSCGYRENTEDEKKYSDDFDFYRTFVGENDSQFVNVAYTSGVGGIGYGRSCTFTRGNSHLQSNVTPYYPDVPDVKSTKTVCPICHGTKEVTCTSCKGEGKLYVTRYAPDLGGGGGGSYKEGHTCMNCRGSGRSMCTRCVGLGYIY